MADDTQQREADEREYEDDSDDLDDLDALEGGAEDQDESPADAEDDEEESAAELLALVSEADEPHGEATPARVTPIESRQEFVCARCRLVKPRVQLADPARGLCRDCA